MKTQVESSGGSPPAAAACESLRLPAALSEVSVRYKDLLISVSRYQGSPANQRLLNEKTHLPPTFNCVTFPIKARRARANVTAAVSPGGGRPQRFTPKLRRSTGTLAVSIFARKNSFQAKIANPSIQDGVEALAIKPQSKEKIPERPLPGCGAAGKMCRVLSVDHLLLWLHQQKPLFFPLFFLVPLYPLFYLLCKNLLQGSAPPPPLQLTVPD